MLNIDKSEFEDFASFHLEVIADNFTIKPKHLRWVEKLAVKLSAIDFAEIAPEEAREVFILLDRFKNLSRSETSKSFSENFSQALKEINRAFDENAEGRFLEILTSWHLKQPQWVPAGMGMASKVHMLLPYYEAVINKRKSTKRIRGELISYFGEVDFLKEKQTPQTLWENFSIILGGEAAKSESLKEEFFNLSDFVFNSKVMLFYSLVSASEPVGRMLMHANHKTRYKQGVDNLVVVDALEGLLALREYAATAGLPIVPAEPLEVKGVDSSIWEMTAKLWFTSKTSDGGLYVRPHDAFKAALAL